MRDAEALQAMGVGVDSRAGPGGGYRLAEEASLRPLQLTGSEAFLLMLAIDALEQMSDLPFQRSRETLVAKVKALLPALQSERAISRLRHVSMDIPERKARVPHMDGLVENCGTWVELVYDGEGGPARSTVFLQRVLADAGLWYAAVETESGSRRLRADRILEITPAPGPEQPPESKPYDHPDHPLVQVTLSFRGLRMVERDPHMGHLAHGLTPPATIEFRCPPAELDWYARYFGGMGEHAIVQGPPELVDFISSRAAEQLERYRIIREKTEIGDNPASPESR